MESEPCEAAAEGVNAVLDAWTSHEVWGLECLSCATTWDEEFEVRHSGDGHGNEAVIYVRDGQPCTTPWMDRCCPKCGSENIKALSAVRGRQGEVPKARSSSDVAMVFHLRRMHAW
ncbi:hypothetical protein SAMN04489713_103404 [Actinomadura madurae]|uniref:C2H2-type domain-containing protein n=1 Tax=Actinomadura madurae TaxID=1993 RepID=A0A1I5CWH5_9ACTN|nr:hypothetical protein SAMN04489713_103404 [Actinomadura madurae]SPT50556.1 Uncharacterised protein [Actinomadura madurae]